MTAQEKLELKEAIDNLPDDTTTEEFAEELIIGYRGMRVLTDKS